jgi:hypothetical protein
MVSYGQSAVMHMRLFGAASGGTRMHNLGRRIAALLAITAAAAIAPSFAAAATQASARIASPAEAVAQDAAEYARRYALPLDEAMRRLRAQEESVAATNEIQETYRDRLAGISIEHRPDYRIVVLLTGEEAVQEQAISAGGMIVPILFKTGAAATRERIAEAIVLHQAAIRAAFPRAQGMGLDARTGELVLLVRASDAEAEGVEAMKRQVEEITGVPVLIRVLRQADANLGLEGGARVEGIDPRNGRRYTCTTGFIVADGSRRGVITAAHCPDALSYKNPEGGETELSFVGQWGARYQDVQVHVGDVSAEPLFQAGGSGSGLRALTSWRNRTSTRAGDAVCHRGETTGYSCSEVELIDFAPPGDLCGGPCDPTWISVTGPSCRGGDSGGPVFSGTIAFGIAKGASYSNGRCNFYYYMSTDFLPEGWSLLTTATSSPASRSAGLRASHPRPSDRGVP